MAPVASTALFLSVAFTPASTCAPGPIATALVAVVIFVAAPNAIELAPSTSAARPIATPSFTFVPSLVTLPVVGSTVFTTPTRAFGPKAKEFQPLTLEFVPNANAFQ